MSAVHLSLFEGEREEQEGLPDKRLSGKNLAKLLALLGEALGVELVHLDDLNFVGIGDPTKEEG